MVAGGCGGSHAKTKPPPPMSAGQPFADDFVRRLIVVGRWSAIEADVPSAMRQHLREFQATVRKDGVNQVVGPGRLRTNCPKSIAAGVGSECFYFTIVGHKVVPVGGRTTLKAQLRLWVAYEDGAWRLKNYDYIVLSR